jgi:hypothetical protein
MFCTSLYTIFTAIKQITRIRESLACLSANRLLTGRRAWNAISGRIYDFDASYEPRRLNLLWRLFCDPFMTRRLLNIEEGAENAVGMFRTMYVEHDASIFADLLDELRESPLFCRLWWATNVGRPATALLRLRLDDGQLLQLNSIRAQQPELPGLTLFMQSPADDASRAILERMHWRR